MTKGTTFACLALAFLALAAVPSEASHFRYGTLRWRLTENQPSDTKIRVAIVVELGFRLSWAEGQGYSVEQGRLIDLDYLIDLGDGVVAHMHKFEITASDTKTDILMGIWEGYHYYEPSQNPFTIVYQDCCRMSGLGNNNEGDWRLETLLDLDVPGHQSATSSFLPLVQIGDIGVQTIEMAGLSPNKDALIWELADEARMEGVHPSDDPNVFNIDRDTGVISWNVEGFKRKTYTTQILLSGVDSPHVKIPIDFFIEIKRDEFLCVNACSNAGELCGTKSGTFIATAPTVCTGDCVTSSYTASDPCMLNYHPHVTVIDYTETVFGKETVVEVELHDNPFYEEYQKLSVVTGSLPRGASWVYDEVAGHGTLRIPPQYEHMQYAACFKASDGFMYGTPTCTRIDIVRPDPPSVFAPEEVKGYTEEYLEFGVHFDDSYTGDFHHLIWDRSSSGTIPECVKFDTEDHDGLHGYKGLVTIDVSCSMTTMDFLMCFRADDYHQTEHDYGENVCTHVELEPRPNMNCNDNYKSFETCMPEEADFYSDMNLCYWDKDGVDHWMTNTTVGAGLPGCFDFHECNQMNDSKNACLAHSHCHYGHFGECLPTHHESEPYSEENWEGDHCRGYSKKECREVDGRKRKGVDFHCAWEPINGWCVSPEIHLPHSDLCRQQHDQYHCDRAKRNGRMCNWWPDEKSDLGGKCRGEIDFRKAPCKEGPCHPEQRIVSSDKDFATPKITDEKGYSKDDFEHGTFLHWEHHFPTHEEHFYTHDNLHYVDYDYDYRDTHDYVHIHETV